MPILSRRTLAVRGLKGWVAAAMLTAPGLFGPSAASAVEPDAAQSFIESVANDMLTLVDKPISVPEKEAEFRGLIEQKVAIADVARVSLGVPWRGISEEQKSRYVAAFLNYLASVYVRRFDEYNGENLEIVSAQDAGAKGVFVKTRVTGRPDGAKPIDVDWRVTDRNGPMQILDIYVEGVSLVITQQTDFSTFLDRNGGDVERLIQHLESQTVLAQSSG